MNPTSHIVRHIIKSHPDLSLETEENRKVSDLFKMEVVNKFRTSMDRQLSEALAIARDGGLGSNMLMNGCEEYNRCIIPELLKSTEVKQREQAKRNRDQEMKEMEQHHRSNKRRRIDNPGDEVAQSNIRGDNNNRSQDQQQQPGRIPTTPDTPQKNINEVKSTNWKATPTANNKPNKVQQTTTMGETTTNTEASQHQQQTDNNISQKRESHAKINNTSEKQQQHENNTNVQEARKDGNNSQKENVNKDQQQQRKQSNINNKAKTSTTTTTKKENNTYNKKNLIQLTVKGQKVSLVNPNKKKN